MAVSEQIKKRIIQTAIKEIVFNPVDASWAVNQKELTDAEWRMLCEEAAKEGHSVEELRLMLSDVIQNEAIFSPKIRTVYHIDPLEIKIGQHLRLSGISDVYGVASLELICLASNQWMVVSSGRHVLCREDMLEAATTPWNVGYVVDFKVSRNGKRYPDTQSIYRTFKLERIEFLDPADVYEYLDQTVQGKKDEMRIQLKKINVQECSESPVHSLYLIAKESIESKTFVKDYPVLKRMAGEMGIPLYSFHKLIEQILIPKPDRKVACGHQAFVKIKPDDITDIPSDEENHTVPIFAEFSDDKKTALKELMKFKKIVSNRQYQLISLIIVLLIFIFLWLSKGSDSDLSDSLKSAKEKIERLTEEKNKLEGNMNLMNSNSMVDNSIISSLQTDKSNFESSLNQLKKENEKLIGDNEQQKNDNARLKNDNAKLTNDNASLKNELNAEIELRKKLEKIIENKKNENH